MKKIIISGSSNSEFAKSLSRNKNIELGEVEISCFANKEKRIRVRSDVKDKEVIIVQSGCGVQDEYIIEVCLLSNAVKNMGAKKISLVMPWISYSPQDKIFLKGEPLSSKVIINLLEQTEINKFYHFDLHSEKLFDFFRKPFVNLSTEPLFIDYFNSIVKDRTKWVVLGVDKGDYAKAGKFAKVLQLNLVKLSKTRNLNTGEVTFQNIEGSVEGKNVVVFDDYVSTGQTLIKSADYIKMKGANKYCFCVTHIIVENALPMIMESKIDRLFTTNSIHLPTIAQYEKAVVLDISTLVPV